MMLLGSAIHKTKEETEKEQDCYQHCGALFAAHCLCGAHAPVLW